MKSRIVGTWTSSRLDVPAGMPADTTKFRFDTQLRFTPEGECEYSYKATLPGTGQVFTESLRSGPWQFVDQTRLKVTFTDGSATWDIVDVNEKELRLRIPPSTEVHVFQRKE